MASTSLAYISEFVDNLLTKERKNPTPHQMEVVKATAPRKIGGFHVTDQKFAGARLEEAREKRLKIVAQYYEQRKEVLAEFDAIKVKPLAILPTGMFKKLCQDTGMYFVPKTGRTQVNPTHFLTWAQNKFPAEISYDEAVMATIFEAIQQGQVRQVVKLKKRDVETTVQAYIQGFPHNLIVRRLLNAPIDGSDVKLGEMQGSTPRSQIRRFNSPTDRETYELLLPEPPQSVVDRLIKCANVNMQLQTVAVYEALDFVGGVDPILRKAANDLAEHEERERERINWQLHDPIVYLERGSVTAIVDQFGPFPIEKQLVDRIQAAEFLPVNFY